MRSLVGKWKKKVRCATPAAVTIAPTSAVGRPDQLNSAMAVPMRRSRVCRRLASPADGLSATAMASTISPGDFSQLARALTASDNGVSPEIASSV